MLEYAYLTEGIREGVTALYQRLRDENGNQAPTRAEVADWLRARPESQIARMPVKDVSVAPVLPRAEPLSIVFMDTMMMPPTSHDGGPGVGRKVYRAIVVFVDALTKFATLHGVFQLVAGHPQSAQTAEGAREFLRQARAAMNDPNANDVHVRRWVSDKGSEFLRGPNGQGFENWNEQQEAANPGLYQHVKTPGTRSSYNSIAEATIKTIRRLFYGKHKAWVREQDDNNVPAQRRRFDWMEFLQDVQDTYNTKWHSTIKTQALKAIDSQRAPDYATLQRTIVQKAVKKYGRRAQLDEAASIPGFSAYGLLQVGQYVRRKRWKDGGGVAALRWSRIDNKTADNNYSEQIFAIRRVNRGQGMKRTTYVIDDLNGNEQPGNYSREQLLGPLPPETFDNLTDDNSDDDDDEDNDGAIAADADADDVDPSPRVAPNRARYRIGDRLQFAANYFAVGQFAGLTPPIVRGRVGSITQAPDRAKLFDVGYRVYYKIRFDGERSNDLPRNTPDGIDNDTDVTYIDAG